MADAVTIYRWDDPGAPQFSSNMPNTIEYINVFKACLVDGYGTKAGAGWTVAEDLTADAKPSMAFRNAGSGGVTRVFNDGTDSRWVTVQSYQEYVDKDNNGKASFSASGVLGSNAGPVGWVLIASSKAFYFICTPDLNVNYWGTSSSRSFIFHCGDFYSVFPNDPCTFTQICGSGGNADISSSARTTVLPNVLTDDYRTSTNIYALDNTNTSKQYSLLSALGVGQFKVGGVDAAPPQINVMSDVWLKLGATSTTSYYSAGTLNDPSFPMLRGRVAGLFISDQSGWRSDPFPVIKTIGGSDYLQMPCYGSSTSAVWVKLGEWQ